MINWRKSIVDENYHCKNPPHNPNCDKDPQYSFIIYCPDPNINLRILPSLSFHTIRTASRTNLFWHFGSARMPVNKYDRHLTNPKTFLHDIGSSSLSEMRTIGSNRTDINWFQKHPCGNTWTRQLQSESFRPVITWYRTCTITQV